MKRPAARLVIVAAALGVVAGLSVGLLYRAEIGPLAGWVVAGLTYLTVTWHAIWPMDADATAAHAASEDPSRGIADAATLLAAVANLAVVAVLIGHARSTSGPLQATEVGFGLGAVVVSWLLLHTLFTLRYARLYYQDGEGGVEYESKIRPPYSDFAYLAFTVGMTFQVSDTDLQTSQFRRVVLRHALLSYLFGAVILAAVINLIAGLVR